MVVVRLFSAVLLLSSLLLFFAHLTDAIVPRRPKSVYNPNIYNALPAQYSYKTMYLTQNLDHFGFDNNLTFHQRYLMADQFWNNDGGPIFFYTGNEGDIVWFCNNTGFMWDTAPEFKSLLVFAEHRYYGKSLPFGPESYANSTMLNYLTAEQALADYAELIRFLKETVPGAAHSPVITVGGSYGGMLAAWMRLRYPNMVSGALASSAPLWQFSGLSACSSFYEVVSNDFYGVSHDCGDNLRRGWSTLLAVAQNSADGMEFISKAFSLCEPLAGPYDLVFMTAWLIDVYTNLTVVDYPYPASILQPLPAWPVKEFCQHLLQPYQHKALLQQVALGVKMFFNYTGQATCINIPRDFTVGMGNRAWDYQMCTEMVMPTCSNNTGVFPKMDWDFDSYVAICKSDWGVTPRKNWISLNYWGKNIQSASNIIFSNGLLDPWSGGGILQSLSPSLVAVQIPSGAHQLDLRAKNQADPTDLTEAREREKSIMKTWLYGPSH